jgi:hypothetical protein
MSEIITMYNLFNLRPYRYQSGMEFAPTASTPIAWLGTDVLAGPNQISRYVISVYKHPQYNPANNGVRIRMPLFY